MGQDEYERAVHDLIERHRDVRDDPGGVVVGTLGPRETWLYLRLQELGPNPPRPRPARPRPGGPAPEAAGLHVEVEIENAAGLAPETAAALGLTGLVLALARTMRAAGLTKDQAVGRIGSALDVAWEGPAAP